MRRHQLVRIPEKITNFEAKSSHFVITTEKSHKTQKYERLRPLDGLDKRTRNTSQNNGELLVNTLPSL